MPGGKTTEVYGQTWTFPGGAQCTECHTEAAGFALGPETAQLNREQIYPTTGITADQLQTLNHIGMFRVPLNAESDELPRLANPFDTGADLNDRARAYLHTNCSQCHRPGTANPASMDFRYQTALANTNACDVIPGLGDLGLGPDARLIAPGSAAESVIVARMSRRDSDGMPPVGSHIADLAGAAVLSQWIDSLNNCN